MKKLIGRTDLEDGLKRLDKLTQEEARMATVHVLKAMHIVDDRVRGVADQVVGVDDRVTSVDERVRMVDDKVAEVIEGAQFFTQSPQERFDLDASRWKRIEGGRRPNKTFVISLPHIF